MFVSDILEILLYIFPLCIFLFMHEESKGMASLFSNKGE